MEEENETIDITPEEKKIEYPKPLPERSIEYKTDENGFPMWEKVALKRAWNQIEPFQRRYGAELFQNFLIDNEYVIDHFQFNRKIDLELLHGYGVTLIKLLGKLINTLDSKLEFRATLEEILLRHKLSGIPIKELNLLFGIIEKYLTNSPALCKHASQTFTKAMNRLLCLVEQYFVADEEANRLHSDSSENYIIVSEYGNKEL